MKRLLVLIVSLAVMSQVEALPTGVGEIGDNGCVCHGASAEETMVNLSGLPDVYNSSQTYNLTTHNRIGFTIKWHPRWI